MINTRTDRVLLIYLRLVDGSEKRYLLAPRIPPHSSVEASDTCASQVLVARTRGGDRVIEGDPSTNAT